MVLVWGSGVFLLGPKYQTEKNLSILVFPGGNSYACKNKSEITIITLRRIKQATHNNSSLMDKISNVAKYKQAPRGKVLFHEWILFLGRLKF